MLMLIECLIDIAEIAAQFSLFSLTIVHKDYYIRGLRISYTLKLCSEYYLFEISIICLRFIMIISDIQFTKLFIKL